MTALASGLAARSTPIAHTVSGFSSGGSLAVNHLVAFSSVVSGAGVLGGSPYGCNALPDAVNVCSGMGADGVHRNESIPWDAYTDLCAEYAAKREARGAIDQLAGLRGRQVFLFSGTADSVVFQPVMVAVQAQLSRWGANVTARFDLPSEHAWIVDRRTCAHPGQTELPRCCGGKGSAGTRTDRTARAQSTVPTAALHYGRLDDALPPRRATQFARHLPVVSCPRTWAAAGNATLALLVA